jgi:hypothetical protein
MHVPNGETEEDTMTRNLIVALTLTCAVAVPHANAENGEGFFSVSASTDTEFLNVTAVDPNTLMPLPSTFTANSEGEYELSGLIVLDGDTANPIGDFEISGLGDPHLQTKVTLVLSEDAFPIQIGDALFLQLLAGIEVGFGVVPSVRIESVQTTTMTGSPGSGSPPFDPRGYTSVFLETEDHKSANAVDAGVGGLLQFGTKTFQSGVVELPELPPDSMEESFSRLVSQQDLSFFHMSQDTSVTLESLARIEILVASTGIPGDYNNDGKVDAADYVLWRKNVGKPAGTLPNDTAGGEIGDAQYRLWNANFGAASNGSGSSAAIPEPATIALCLLALPLLVRRAKKTPAR